MLLRRVSGMLLLGAVMVLPGMAMAEEIPAAENPKVATLPEVVVTANKQKENIQKVPQSVTAISGQQATDAHLQTIDQLGMRIPNLIFSTGGMGMVNLPTMRGVRSDPHSNIPSVTMYIDDVPVASNAGYISQLYDIESIEVLRGPHGTLYGRNAEGGVIKITTRKPQDTLAGGVTFEAGNKERIRTAASLSGPVIQDRLYAGGSFQYFGQDGWVNNEFKNGAVDDKKNYSGRGTFRFTPSEDLQMTFSYGMVKYDEGAFSMYNLMSPQKKRQTNSQDPGYNKSSFNDQSLNIAWNMSPSWTFTSVTTRRETDLDYAMDYDFSPARFFEVHKYDRSLDLGQEFRFSYNHEGVNAVIGAMYGHLDKKVRYNYFNMPMPMKHFARDKTDSYAVFGQAKVPFGDNWAVTAGARIDYYTTKFNDHDTGFSDSDSWTSFSPKLALEYSISSNNLLYASASRGFRAAGYDAYQGSPGHYKFDEEELWAFELGSKNTILGGKGKLNGALFYHKFKDMQLESYNTSAMGPMPTIKNVGNPDAFGAELELTYTPLAGLELFGAVGYTHMRYDEFTDALGDHKGNKIPYVPELTYSAGVQYRHPKGFFARAEVLGASRSFLDSTNDGYVPAHATVNTKIGWEFEHLDLYFFAENLFDTRYDYVNAFGGSYGVATPGLLVGGSATWHF